MADDLATAVTQTPVERARGIADLISAEAPAGERLGRLTDAAAEALFDAGLFSMFLPAADGGLDATRAQFFEAVEAVARADGSAGWCLSVCATIADFAWRGASAEARAEIFAAGPVALWTSLLPRATSTPAEGGFRAAGAFSMGSGSAHASWVLIPARIPSRDGMEWFRAHILPTGDVAIRPESWDVMGLRATTSIEYVLDDVFVPAHRTFEYPYVERRASEPVSFAHGVRLNQMGLAAFACGVARRALDELLASAPATRRTVGEGSVADDPVVQFGIGDLEGRLLAARTRLVSLIAEQDRACAAGGMVGLELANETGQAAQILARAGRELVIFAFDSAGANVIFMSHPIQRCLRDIFTGMKHASFTPALLTNAGKARLDKPRPAPRLPSR
jgi:alkylation response protein AidB-like acyl-CoA dehydrogenase